MTEKPTKKEETRAKILDAASQGFRSQGFAGVGVDGIAQAAGVTSGAFYAHFGSKAGAFSAALAAGLDEAIKAVPVFQQTHGQGWVKAFADYYLGKPHRDDLAGGCAMTTMTPEVVRSSDGLQFEYEEKMTKIASLISQGLAGESKPDRKARAWAFLGTLIGGLNVARAMSNPNTSEEIASAIIAGAIKAAGPTL